MFIYIELYIKLFTIIKNKKNEKKIQYNNKHI